MISVNEECLICNSPLEYLSKNVEMECYICKKVENSKSRCVNGHYVCNDCHMKGLSNIIDICLNETSTNPIKILNKIMHEDFCHMHGPEHHSIVGACLLTAYYNAGGRINLEKSLLELLNRAREVPGGICGYWGACGAGISSGIFVSIISKSTPLSLKPFSLSNKMTSNALNSISEHGGPRCCKRDSYLSILSAIDFVKENFDLILEKEENIVCSFSEYNNQCIMDECPFYPKK